MATLITSGANVISPTIVLGFTSTRASMNNIHDVVARANPDVSLRPAGLRSGTYELGFAGDTSEMDSFIAEALLATPVVFTVVSDERTTVQLSFVLSGNLTRALETETRDAWIVSFDWQEVTA